MFDAPPEVIVCVGNEFDYVNNKDTIGLIYIGPELLDFFKDFTKGEIIHLKLEDRQAEEIVDTLLYASSVLKKYKWFQRLIVVSPDISYASAIALLIRTLWYKFDYKLALAVTIAQRPNTVPDLGLVGMGDYIMGLEGKLFNLIEEYQVTELFVTPTGGVLRRS